MPLEAAMIIKQKFLASLAVALIGISVSLAPPAAAERYGDWFQGAVLFMPHDSDPAVVLRARNNLKAITVGFNSQNDMQGAAASPSALPAAPIAWRSSRPWPRAPPTVFF
jgi:hypothetical protein